MEEVFFTCCCCCLLVLLAMCVGAAGRDAMLRLGAALAPLYRT